jgi:outer membrane lipoprotein-sorting protein
MRNIFVATVLLAISATGASAAYTDQEVADLDHLSEALNAIHSLKADFVQIDPNSAVEHGQVYIDKPGKMRFEYKPPSVLTVVSDGIDVVVFNRKLNTTDRYPLSTTPLNILLSAHVNLRENKNVIGIDRQHGDIVVHARSSDRRTNGNMAIVFTPDFHLKQWTVVDEQGLATTVTISNVQTDMTLAPELFLTHG